MFFGGNGGDLCSIGVTEKILWSAKIMEKIYYSLEVMEKILFLDYLRIETSMKCLFYFQIHSSPGRT